MSLTLDDDVLGGSVKLKTSSPVALIAKPCYSVSQSEGGFEKIMQAVTLALEWPLSSRDMVVSLEVRTSQDIAVPLPDMMGTFSPTSARSGISARYQGGPGRRVIAALKKFLLKLQILKKSSARICHDLRSN